MSYKEVLDKISEVIYNELPSTSEITNIEFEGAEVAVYSKNPRVLVNDETIVKELAKKIRKRIVIRSDPSVRLPKDETIYIINELVGKEGEITSFDFDDIVGEVIIEALKPGVIIGKSGEMLRTIIAKTFWRPRVIRTPPIESRVIKSIRHLLQENAQRRLEILRNIGKRIHRPSIYRGDTIRVTALGGYGEVGRSASLVQTGESNVLVDCGINVGTTSPNNMFPRFDLPEFDIEQLDAVIVSHAHLDHCLPPDTPIQMANGSWKPIKDIKVGDRLLSFNWKTGKHETAICIGKTITTGHKSRIEVKTPYVNIESSPNHRFFIIENLDVKEIEASDLRKGMLLPISKFEIKNEKRNKENNIALVTSLLCKEKAKSAKTTTKEITLPSTLCPKLAQLVGYIQGKGGKWDETELRILEEDETVIKNYAKTISELFNVPVSIQTQLKKDLSIPIYYIELKNSRVLKFLEINFPTIFLKDSDRVPDKILESSKEIILFYLKGLFDAKGSISNDIRLYSSNISFLKYMQNIFYQLSIPVFVNTKDLSLCITNPQAIKIFSRKIGFSSEVKKKKLRLLLQNVQKRTNYLTDLVPISTKDVVRILEDVGIIGKHRTSKLSVPSSLLGIQRGEDKYITRNIAKDLIILLNARYDELELLKTYMDTSHWKANQNLNILQDSSTSMITSLTCIQLQHLRSKRELLDEPSGLISKFLIEQILKTQKITLSYIRKIRHILTLNVNWLKITGVKIIPNTSPLVDIEVKPNANFIANGIIVHNSGFVPYLFKYGYDGPVYCTRPTRDLMTLLQIDYLDVATKEGKLLPYEQREIRETVLHTIVLDYGEVTDISPDIRLTFHNAGHIVGSAIPHLHVGEGLYNLAFAHDIKFSRSRLLDPAVHRFPRLETLFIESTYGKPQDVLPPRSECEKLLKNIVFNTINRGGKVLIPVLAVGRAQEIIVVLEQFMRKGELPKVPIYTDGMIKEASAITICHPEFLSKSLRDKIFHEGENPFLAEEIKQVTSNEERERVVSGDPAIILATSGMLTGGPSVYYFKELCEDKNNTLVFVSYQGKGTLGSRIQKGIREIQLMEEGKAVMYHVAMEVHSISGFTGHADRKELEQYVMRVSPKPERFVVLHGEESKTAKFAAFIYKSTKRESLAPPNGTTIRLS